MKELPQIYAISLDAYEDINLLAHLDEDDDVINFVAAYGAKRVQGNTWTFDDAYFFIELDVCMNFYSKITESLRAAKRSLSLNKAAHSFAQEMADAIAGDPRCYFVDLDLYHEEGSDE